MTPFVRCPSSSSSTSVHTRARRSDNPDFAEFTFDHRLDGVIAGERDDTGELFLLRVSDSTISHETVVPGVRWWDSPDVLDGL